VALLAGFVTAPAAPPAVPTSTLPPGDRGDEERFRFPPQLQEGPGLACEQSYRGIGIAHGYTGGYITAVAPGGPADRAGILVGDRLLSEAIFVRDQWEIGKRIPLSIEREGRQIDLVLTIARICYEIEPIAHSIPHLKERP
jgi:C-terminal processing protease CtpA/Prc